MMRKLLGTLLALWASAGTAAAQCGSYPNTLTNGQTADANQVMANFNFVLNCLNSNLGQPLQGYLSGLALANNAGSPNTVVDIAAGVATSDDATTSMKITAFTKNANAAWAVGSGNGALDSGAALAASTWYHVFVIVRTDTNVVDILLSTSAVSPTLPANYTKKRRIGSIKTDASSNILAFVQRGQEFWWKAPIQDVGSVGTADISFSLPSVPPNVVTKAIMNAYQIVGAAFNLLYLHDPAANSSTTPSFNAAPLATLYDNSGGTGNGAIGMVSVWTNGGSPAQINVRSGSANTNLRIATLGWFDPLGK